MKSILTTILLSGLICAHGAEYNFPGPDKLPTIKNLPDPFLMHDGSRVKTPKDWLQQRDYLKAMLMHWEYGFRPPNPGNTTGREISSASAFDGKAIKKEIEISCGPVTGNEIKFRVGLYIPVGDGPFPVIIKNDRSIFNIPVSEEGVDRGYIMADYGRHDLDSDERESVGPAQAAYPEYDWGTLMVWAWGTSRIVDWLETVDYADESRVVVTGHSRGGKTALLAAAYDERIAIAVPSGSGEGGSGSWKYLGEGAESKDVANWIEKRDYWVSPRYGEFLNQEDKLPYDQHFLKALVAPRPLMSTEGTGDVKANAFGNHQTNYGAQVIYDWLDAGDNLGLHFRPGGHAQNEENWLALLDFADLKFFGKGPKADLYQSHFPPEDNLMSWEAPAPVSDLTP